MVTIWSFTKYFLTSAKEWQNYLPIKKLELRRSPSKKNRITARSLCTQLQSSGQEDFY